MTFKYFDRDEFKCKCSRDHPNLIRDEFIADLDRARELAGFAFIINSGYRCPEHNSRVSQTGTDGPHTTGFAADIKIVNSSHRYQLLNILISMGYNRFGIAKTFVHVDRSPDHPPNVIWLY